MWLSPRKQFRRLKWPFIILLVGRMCGGPSSTNLISADSYGCKDNTFFPLLSRFGSPLFRYRLSHFCRSVPSWLIAFFRLLCFLVIFAFSPMLFDFQGISFRLGFNFIRSKLRYDFYGYYVIIFIEF